MALEIRFIPHAEEQLAARGISRADVRRVLRSPHDEFPCPKPNRRRASLNVGKGRVLEVVFKPKPW